MDYDDHDDILVMMGMFLLMDDDESADEDTNAAPGPYRFIRTGPRFSFEDTPIALFPPHFRYVSSADCTSSYILLVSWTHAHGSFFNPVSPKAKFLLYTAYSIVQTGFISTTIIMSTVM